MARARRAHDIFESVAGANDPRTITSLTLVAKLMTATGDSAGAIPLFERAFAAQEKRLGAAHPALATTLNNLAAAHAARHDDAAAIAAYDRALAIAEKALGFDHRRLAYSLVGLGEAHARLRAFDLAIAHLRRVLAILEKGEPDREGLGEVRLVLADALWRSNRDRPSARALAEQASKDLDGTSDPALRAKLASWPRK